MLTDLLAALNRGNDVPCTPPAGSYNGVGFLDYILVVTLAHCYMWPIHNKFVGAEPKVFTIS